MSRWAWVGLGVLALVALGALAVYLGRGTGFVEIPGRAPVLLVGASPAQLDTVDIDGRRVSVTFSGTVRQIDADGTALVAWDNEAFRVRLAEADLDVDDRVLGIGRLRSWRGRRWLAVDDWSQVTASMR